MNASHQLVVFMLDAQRYALHLSRVERIVRVVEITSLPKTPEIVLGVVNVQGRITPVVNIRKRFRLAERDIQLSDRLIVARTAGHAIALLADEVTGLIACADEAVAAADGILPGLEYLEGVVKLSDGLILIHNLDTFLSVDEGKSLARAMSRTTEA